MKIDYGIAGPPYTIKAHLDMEHGDSLRQLIYSKSKYSTLTENKRSYVL